MNEFIRNSNDLSEKEITKILELLGADFDDHGKISEVLFLDSDNELVKIIDEQRPELVNGIFETIRKL